MERSRLVLGTVQLGMPYGVSGNAQPTKEDAFLILDAAYDGGINTFDTAASYGEAESVLGEWIESRRLKDVVFVISKLRAASAASQIRSELEASLKRLRIEVLDGYLLHAPESMYDAGTIEALESVRRAELTRHVGVSIYQVRDALHAARAGLEYIQVPYNALDRRLDTAGFFKEAAITHARVFARSVLLQGLLAMDKEKIPARVSLARPFIERFHDIAKSAGLTPLSAAFQYALSRERIQHVVFGVQSLRELGEILASVHTLHGEQWMNDLEREFVSVPEEVVDPSKWSAL
ncbi:aldo/keto reductase [Candidatus Kaiserbacteria bacterium]|nr:aldo/keto reductase [Candidatus Kaiserbacteria bacterium]